MSDPEHPQPPEEQHPPDKRKEARGIGAGIAGLGVLALKLLGSLKFLVIFGKLFAVSWTFLLSLWLYVVLFGWRFALVLMVLILAHEFGHYAAFRSYGLPARLPQFIPLLGAYTMGALPNDLETDAYIALAGPLLGLGLSGACFAIGRMLNDPFWLAVASVSAFLNLFNMLPMPPFDGGRVIGAVWPPLWILGSALFVVVALLLHVPMLFVILIALLGIPAIVSVWRGHVDPRAAALTLAGRTRISLAYLGTLLGLIVMLAAAPAVSAAR